MAARRSLRTKPIDFQPAKVFDVVSYGEEAVVIDTNTGHEVASPAPTWVAQDVCEKMNIAAAYGGDRLAAAMGV